MLPGMNRNGSNWQEKKPVEEAMTVAQRSTQYLLQTPRRQPDVGSAAVHRLSRRPSRHPSRRPSCPSLSPFLLPAAAHCHKTTFAPELTEEGTLRLRLSLLPQYHTNRI